MWHWTINNKLFTGQFFRYWVCSFMVFMVAPAIADTEGSVYSMQKAAEQSNPWALPQEQQTKPAYQQQPYTPQPYNPQPYNSQPYNSQPYNPQPYNSQPYNPQQYDSRQQYQPAPGEMPGRAAQNRADPARTAPSHQWQPQADRFVTPQFLDSLKKQQQYYQLMPENQRYQQPSPGQYVPVQPQSSLPGQGAYGYPSYGSGSVNPLYDAPAVSPWGDGADVLYRGESFPLVPSEAIGGIPPMHVPSFGMDNFRNTEPDDSVVPYENNVFNPFTFLPK